jgi:hypothetical protein
MVGDEQINIVQVTVRIAVAAHQKIPGPEYLESFLVQRDIGAAPGTQMRGKRRELHVGWNNFVAAAGLQHNSCKTYQSGRHNETPSHERFHIPIFAGQKI